MARATTFRITLAVSLGLLAGPVLAQADAPLRAADTGLVLDAVGHALLLPRPDWALDPATDPLTLVETVFRATGREAVLQLYPRGQTQALWTTLYGARIALEPGRSLPEFRNSVVASFGRTCQPDATAFFQLGADQGDTLAPLGFVCGAYNQSMGAFVGLGEVMVMSFRRTEAGVGMVYQEWRGPAFDPADPQSWPVETQVVEARAAELQRGVALVQVD
jgi:hypothetical protein